MEKIEINSLNILFVEDNEHDRIAFERTLRKNAGYTFAVTECAHAEDAMARLEAGPRDFDVAVVDHRLPGTSGLELCRTLLADYVELAVVVLTGSGSEQLAVDALKSGVDEYVIKDPDEGYLSLLPVVLGEAVRKRREAKARQRAEEALRESRGMLHQIIEGSPVPTFVIDSQHVVAHWNRACERIIGVPANEMIGTSNQWRAFYAEERPVMADLILDGALEDDFEDLYDGKCRKSSLIEGAYEAESYFPHFPTGPRWLFFTAAPIRNESGDIVGAVETLQDVTERKRAEEALLTREADYRRLSITDGLTQLYNSRHFYERLAQEAERSTRYAHPLSIVLMDIDRFKQTNDTHGHLAGDHILAGFAQAIRLCSRGIDSAYRYGGEEFVMLLPETDLDAAKAVAERLRQTVETAVFAPVPGVQVGVTASFGVAQYEPGLDRAAFVQRADQALYEAKAAGRNRVVCWSD
jgi:diguanylate cyclase (GGDEF)-like protein